MDSIFQRLVQTNFSELPGLTVDASIPVSERLINELVTAAVQGNQSITSCRVSIEPQNRLDLHLKTSIWPWPLNLKLKLFGSMDFTYSPTVRAFLENHVLLAKMGALLKALPPGITIFRDQVSMDVEALITDPEQKRLLSLIKTVDIKTETGKLILSVKINTE